MAQRLPPDHPDFPHGDRTGYRWGCREACCREANAEAMRVWRQARGLGTGKRMAKRAGHGTRSRYMVCRAGVGGGKCTPCRAANTAYQVVYMSGSLGPDD